VYPFILDKIDNNNNHSTVSYYPVSSQKERLDEKSTAKIAKGKRTFKFRKPTFLFVRRKPVFESA